MQALVLRSLSYLPQDFSRDRFLTHGRTLLPHARCLRFNQGRDGAVRHTGRCVTGDGGAGLEARPGAAPRLRGGCPRPVRGMGLALRPGARGRR